MRTLKRTRKLSVRPLFQDRHTAQPEPPLEPFCQDTARLVFRKSVSVSTATTSPSLAIFDCKKLHVTRKQHGPSSVTKLTHRKLLLQLVTSHNTCAFSSSRSLQRFFTASSRWRQQRELIKFNENKYSITQSCAVYTSIRTLRRHEISPFA